MDIASMHPEVAGLNMYRSYTEGVDMTGEEIGKGRATFQMAMSMLPFLKISKLVQLSLGSTGRTVAAILWNR